MAQTAADLAYEAAEAEIARVIEAGKKELRLDYGQYEALDRIPEKLQKILALTWLHLDLTQISDIGPLAELKWLHKLSMYKTGVNDLTPLTKLNKLQHLNLPETKVSQLGPLTGLSMLRNLNLSRTKVGDLLPLAGLKELQTLYLDQTEVSDLAPLAGLVGLRRLSFNQTNVSDLRPLIGLINLDGVSFAGTTATVKDRELNRLAQIVNDKIRTRETIGYLKTLPALPAPLPWLVEGATKPEPPEQDPALPLIWGEKGFGFFARSVAADPVTEASLDDVRSLLEDLRRKGNRHDDLYLLAGELQDRSKGEIADLNMVKLHLSFQKLRRLYQSRSTRSEGFDDETVGVMGNVLEILPGVTMADPGVKTLIARQEADRLAGTMPETAKAESDVLNAIQDDDAPFADEVKDIVKAIQEPGQDDRLTATGGILARNSLVAVLKHVGYGAAGAAFFGPIGNYVYDHAPELLALARIMGDDTFFWAQMVLTSFKAEYQIATGLVREAISSGGIPLPRKKVRSKP